MWGNTDKRYRSYLSVSCDRVEEFGPILFKVMIDEVQIMWKRE